MRKCFFSSRILIRRPWGYRGLRIPRSTVLPNPTVKQLSNAELLAILRQDEEDATSTAIAQASSDGLDPQENDIHLQRASLTATRTPRLPQSPLTERRFLAARIRHRAAKPLPFGDRSLFQMRLQKNPYAIALATPLRLCVLTGLRLPSYFQIPFGVATHPKSGAPWHLPKLPSQAVSDPDKHELPSVNPEETQQSPLEPGSSSMALKSSTRTLSSTNFLASRQVLAHVSSLTASKYKKLMPYRWKQDPSVKLPGIVWRGDMDTFVLDILRGEVLKTLLYLASRPAAYILPCKTYDGINDHDQVATVLWLRKDVDTSINDKSSTSGALPLYMRGTGPPPYAMHYHKTRYVPCYNMAALLGPIRIRALQESGPDQYIDQFAIIKRKRNTVKVQLELWKLLGYIIQDGTYG